MLPHSASPFPKSKASSAATAKKALAASRGDIFKGRWGGGVRLGNAEWEAGRQGLAGPD